MAFPLPPEESVEQLFSTRSQSQHSISSFEHFVPIGYFCGENRCLVDIKSIPREFGSILTHEARLTRSFIGHSEPNQLIFILLLNVSAILCENIVFRRDSYWKLKSDHRTMGTGFSMTIELPSTISGRFRRSNTNQNSRHFDHVIQEIVPFYDRRYFIHQRAETSRTFSFPPSNHSQTIRIYQMHEEFEILKTWNLSKFLRETKLDDRCSRSCGFLDILPEIEISTNQLESQIINQFSSLIEDKSLVIAGKRRSQLTFFIWYFTAVAILVALSFVYYIILWIFELIHRSEILSHKEETTI